MSTAEVQQKKCKACSNVSMRINAGKFNDSYNKRWIGEDGRQWNGNLCPNCQRDRAKVNMRRLREERKYSNDSSES